MPVSGQTLGRTVNGELALRALKSSFPDKISSVDFIENDWTITAGGEIFFWAGGRVLPRSEKNNADSFGPHSFYRYAARPTPPEDFPPEFVDSLRRRGSAEARRERRASHYGLYRVLYGGLERREIEALLERIEFLGQRVTVHRDIVQALKRIDAEIRKWSGGAAFIASLGSVHGYSWRAIAGTQRMSYHSWGLAVDIQPRRLGGKAIYWLWESQRNDDWMLIPLENRWNPPDFVIGAFEREGFIWGGKWPFFDNMHFEFRPELHEFTRLLAANPSGTGGPGADSGGISPHHIYPDFLAR